MLKAGINAAPWLVSAGEIDTFFLAGLRVVQVNLDIG